MENDKPAGFFGLSLSFSDLLPNFLGFNLSKFPKILKFLYRTDWFSVNRQNQLIFVSIVIYDWEI
jgi:hypothetical protein